MRTQFFLSAFVSAFVLSGCFLKQNPPSNLVSNGKQVNAVGIVRAEEISGDTTSTTLEASFAEAKARGPRKFRDLDTFDGGLNRVSPREAGCKAYKISQSREEVKLLSVGKLYFGPAFQQLMTEIPENPDHSYRGQLKGALPSYVYAVKGAGSPEIPGFTVPLSFPVPITGLTVSSQTPLQDDLTLSHEQAMKLEWAAPTVPDSGHQMLMEFYSPQGNDVYLLRCAGLESDFGLDGAKRTWIIPAGYMQLMPPTEKGLLYLSRVVLQTGMFPTLQVQTQGFQTFLAKIVLQ